jgi:hypothetical protein
VRPHLTTSLRVLVLSFDRIGPVGAAALAGWPALANLTELFLANNQLGADGVVT